MCDRLQKKRNQVSQENCARCLIEQKIMFPFTWPQNAQPRQKKLHQVALSMLQFRHSKCEECNRDHLGELCSLVSDQHCARFRNVDNQRKLPRRVFQFLLSSSVESSECTAMRFANESTNETGFVGIVDVKIEEKELNSQVLSIRRDSQTSCTLERPSKMLKIC